MNKDNPILTVAIPVFNGGVPLTEAVRSCRYINLPIDEFEVLVVDNASIDGSISCLKNSFCDFKPLRIVTNEVNYGRIENWNKCLEYAKGEFILFLFSNDLIAPNNFVKESLEVLQNNQKCVLVSAPWIISDFRQEKSGIAKQFFKRTPGFGYFESIPYIKKVIESGKLPFVCLQSNFLRKQIIIDKHIRFMPELSISADGVFLSQLALTTNLVAFYEYPSIIWRGDAPSRLHSNLKLSDHVKQMCEAFVLIKTFSPKANINIEKTFANYNGLKYIIIGFLDAKSKYNWQYTKLILYEWWSTQRKYHLNKYIFSAYLLSKMAGSVLNFNTLFKMVFGEKQFKTKSKNYFL